MSKTTPITSYDGLELNKSKNNSRYALLSDLQLCLLARMRLVNMGFFGAENATIEITEKKNSGVDYYTIRFKTTIEPEGDSERHGIVFNKFFINEFDFLHECLAENNTLPVSNLVFIKNQHITNLECSCRGYESALQQLKESIKQLL